MYVAATKQKTSRASFDCVEGRGLRARLSNASTLLSHCRKSNFFCISSDFGDAAI
jgi:hypothetical protein